jgi:alpha-1,3-glucan synthase
MTGSPFINQAWAGDGYGPLDFTLLDHHHGEIQQWRDFIDAAHSRGMYIVMDNTVSTMGDLLGMEGWENATVSVPFSWNEYDYNWKSTRRYWDFEPSNEQNLSCQYPRMWSQLGYPVTQDVLSAEAAAGCRASEYDSYGDVPGIGTVDTQVMQLGKFDSVQDRLREWSPSVMEKLKVMSCMTIAMLDIDGYRLDKAVQITIDALSDFSNYQRQCAKRYGKENFLVIGELVADDALSAIYVGRGQQPDQYYPDMDSAMRGTHNDSLYVRPSGQQALDGTAFQYAIYGSLMRFIGMDSPWGGAGGVDWANWWHKLVKTNDMYNTVTNEFDPRQLFGTTNQDVLRLPALVNGTTRQLLGLMVTLLQMPGIPLLLYGDEQASYILENTADNYVYGRMPMTSSRAWQLHGCYQLTDTPYVNVNFNSSRQGCHDLGVSLDHRDPSHPMHNAMKRFFELRRQYPVLNDGFNLTTLASQTEEVYLAGAFVPSSDYIASTFGIWSVYRGRQEDLQDFTGEGAGNQGVWFVYHNVKDDVIYNFDCSETNVSKAFIAPFPQGTRVKNLLWPYDEYTLGSSAVSLEVEGSTEPNGCFSQIELQPYQFKAFVPADSFVMPAPVITQFSPGHDQRILSTVGINEQESVDFELYFSMEMDCYGMTSQIEIASTTGDGTTAQIDNSTVSCAASPGTVEYTGAVGNAWVYRATLINVSNGMHTLTVRNATTSDGTGFTNTLDKFMLRVGQSDNPIVFPWTANYTSNILYKNANGELYVTMRTPGADLFRYSTNWGSSFSQWMNYTSENTTITPLAWNGTVDQEWEGTHVELHFWSAMAASADHVQHADLMGEPQVPRRWPHAWVQGPFNQYGYDGGLASKMVLHPDTNLWTFDLVDEWPSKFDINVWGMNPDQRPDISMTFGDIDRDGVLDLLPPNTLAHNIVNVTRPPTGSLGWRIEVNDGNLRWTVVGVGSSAVQAVLGVIMALFPILSGCLAIWAYVAAFYQVKFNQVGASIKRGLIPFWPTDDKFVPTAAHLPKEHQDLREAVMGLFKRHHDDDETTLRGDSSDIELATAVEAAIGAPNRRKVLIATMEYNITDWNIGVKIGGLGVMAGLMGKNLGHQDLIWVVPCVGGIDYPVDQPIPSFWVRILSTDYEVKVQTHQVANITYVLLDSPVFRAQTKKDPYPARMDDLDSAVYYSAWNQCIAHAVDRWNPDLYHINDYHGTIAPLYLLPRTIPCAFSLHNAEFQGLWPIKTPEERAEICGVYNLPSKIVEKYVQFGEVFNLLHAGASYLRIHQKGYGAVGVSNKYGKRAWARYPIFWGLSDIGGLPNPDPSDTASWDKVMPDPDAIVIREDLEAERGDLRKQCQEWAGLNIDPEAELFVFVGRWSMQKGVDLIADVFFTVLEENPKVQLLCVGPVIDLYGKFAALKLDKMMKKYPGRVYSKPEFTALPPCIFTGAEFALIPSRDEPFGLVAVEFGRKGALGVGARVGGLGQMPGWWYTIESTTTKHLTNQFKQAIRGALSSDHNTRALMRARSAVQRFPVAQWVEDLEKLQTTALKIHVREANKAYKKSSKSSVVSTPFMSGYHTPHSPLIGSQSPGTMTPSVFPLPTAPNTAYNSRPASPHRELPWDEPVVPVIPSTFGPGHVVTGHPTATNSVDRIRAKLAGLPGLRNAASRNFSISSSRSNSRANSRANSASNSRANSPTRTPSVSLMPGAPHTPRRAASNSHLFAGVLNGNRRSTIIEDEENTPSPMSPDTPDSAQNFLSPANRPHIASPSPAYSPIGPSRQTSMLDLKAIKPEGDAKNYNLQRVDPFFTDPTGLYFRTFENMLEDVTPSNAEGSMAIESYLMKSEKEWFTRYQSAKMGKNSTVSVRSLATQPSRSAFRWSGSDSATEVADDESLRQRNVTDYDVKQFEIDADYVAPNKLARMMQYKVGDWPFFTIILAFGQILAVNSYQVTLLTGSIGESAEKLYVVASIYLVASIGWWVLYRTVKSVYVLTLPWFFYGLAFFLIGMGPVSHSSGTWAWIDNVATAFYAIAASSGSVFFGINFGTDGGAPVKTWVYRACVIQGTQQVYIAVLWYWGDSLTNLNMTGVGTSHLLTSRATLAAVTTPIALLLWAIGAVVFFGLPNYYHQTPGAIPSFYRSVWRRKIVLWFFVTVIIQNYFMSSTYGRNWSYLWSSAHAPAWAIFLLVLVFFVGVWALMMFGFHRLSQHHSWLLPIFAIGLGAPRWAQMLWGVGGLGTYVPWGSPATGALLGRCLWLWLGVLDAVQGVGFGMILLQTLTRFYVVFALLAAQVIGSIATIVARASSPDKLGPGGVFPNPGLHPGEAAAEGWFWGGLMFQLVICVGFLVFFRKEQLFKP